MRDCMDGWITRLGEECAHAAILGLLGLQTTVGLHVLDRRHRATYIDSMLETVELHKISKYSLTSSRLIRAKQTLDEKQG